MNNDIDNKINSVVGEQFIKYLQLESGKSAFQKAAEELMFAYKSFLKVGFNEDQAMDLTIALFQQVLDTIHDEEDL